MRFAPLLSILLSACPFESGIASCAKIGYRQLPLAYLNLKGRHYLSLISEGTMNAYRRYRVQAFLRIGYCRNSKGAS